MKLKRLLVAIGIMSSLTIGGLFSLSNSSIKEHPIFAINYNDSSYDSKYILSPIDASDLSTTAGSNYYIIVSSLETTSGINEEPICVANALHIHEYNSQYISGNTFSFPFTNADNKTIDIRNLGADVGGTIFAYNFEEVQDNASGNIISKYNLFSFGALSYLQVSDTPNGIYLTYSDIYELNQSTSWTVNATTDDNNVDCFTFYDSDDGCYLFNDGQSFVLAGSGSNLNLYLYSVSEALASELSFSIFGQHVNEIATSSPNDLTEEDLLNQYCTLPSIERNWFAYQASGGFDLPSFNETNFASDFISEMSSGFESYENTCTDYSTAHAGPSVDIASLNIDYEHGYITGFSPFEAYLSVATQSSIDYAIETEGPYASDSSKLGYTILSLSRESNDREVEYSYTAHYRDQKLYLANPDTVADGLIFYGQKTYFTYGQYSNEHDTSVTSKTIETIDIDSDPAAGINVSFQIASTEYDNQTVNCIFDEEVQFDQVGTLGDYEYCLVSESLYSSWQSYYKNANLDKMVWQTSPIFQTCLTENGVEPIGEELGMVGYIRKAGGDNSYPSPVISVLNDIFPANYEDGYILRMSILNEQLFNNNLDEYAETYETLSSDSNFADFSLEPIYTSAQAAISQITSRDDAKQANDLSNSSKLEMAYSVYTHMHVRIADELMEAYSLNQTTKSSLINSELISELKTFELDYTSDTDTQLEVVDTLIDSYKAKLTASESIDELCRNFISAFNTALLEHPECRSYLWDIFEQSFNSIHEAESLELAQIAYQDAISQIQQIVSGEDDGGN